jgi:hypothetical protein
MGRESWGAMSRTETLAAKKLTHEERVELAQTERYIADIPRPKTRGDCANVPRPCPFVSCKYHLYLDVNAETKTIKLNFPDAEVEDLKDSCVLDIAESNVTLERVGEVVNVTRERIRQIEEKALLRFRTQLDRARLTEGFAEMLAGRSHDAKRDLTLFDPNPKRLTWDEWRKKFVPKKDTQDVTRVLRRELRTDDREEVLDVLPPLASGEPTDPGRGLFDLQSFQEGSNDRDDPPVPNGHQQGQSGSESQGGEIDAHRDTTGNVGELSLLQNNDARSDGTSPMPEALSNVAAPLPSDESARVAPGQEVSGVRLKPPRDRTPRPVKYSLDNPRPRKQPPTQCKSELGRLSYSLRKHSEGQMLSFAAELSQSPYQEELQDRLRRYLAESLSTGKHQDAHRAQQFLAVLLGHEPKPRKEQNMEKQKASQLLDLLAARPDKADLIEALAIEAGLYAARSPQVSSAALSFDRDVKPEKKTSTDEKKIESRRHLTHEEKERAQHLFDTGWSKKDFAKSIGCPVTSLYGIMEGKIRMTEGCIAKFKRLKPMAQDAE